MRTRLAAVLALVTMAFSITEKAFANECAHGAISSAELTSSEHGSHTSPVEPGPDSSTQDSCRHDAMTGCATSAQVLPASAAVIDTAAEITVAAPSPSTAVDLIRSHAAFHPPRN
jgi:hypothetical protein